MNTQQQNMVKQDILLQNDGKKDIREIQAIGESNMDKPTKDLMNELASLKHKEELEQWIEEHKHENKTFGQYFQDLCEKYGTNALRISKTAGVSKPHLYQVKNDKKILSRKKMVQIGFSLGATKEEIDRLLKCTGHKELYPRKTWDSIILYGLSNHLHSH